MAGFYFKQSSWSPMFVEHDSTSNTYLVGYGWSIVFESRWLRVAQAVALAWGVYALCMRTKRRVKNFLRGFV